MRSACFVAIVAMASFSEASVQRTAAFWQAMGSRHGAMAAAAAHLSACDLRSPQQVVPAFYAFVNAFERAGFFNSVSSASGFAYAYCRMKSLSPEVAAQRLKVASDALLRAGLPNDSSTVEAAAVLARVDLARPAALEPRKERAREAGDKRPQ